MNTLKLTLATSLIAAAAIASIHAAEGLTTPSPSTPASQVMAGSCHSNSHSHAGVKSSGPVIGSPRELSNQSPSVAAGSHSDSKGHCSMMKKGKAAMSCCK